MTHTHSLTRLTEAQGLIRDALSLPYLAHRGPGPHTRCTLTPLPGSQRPRASYAMYSHPLTGLTEAQELVRDALSPPYRAHRAPGPRTRCTLIPLPDSQRPRASYVMHSHSLIWLTEPQGLIRNVLSPPYRAHRGPGPRT